MRYGELRNVALIAVIALLVGVVLLIFISKILTVLTVLYVSVVLSHALEPVVALAEEHRIPRFLTILAIYLLLLAAFGLLLFIIVPPLIVQVAALVEAAPEALANLELLVQSFRIFAAQSELASIIATGLARLGQEVVGYLDALIVVPLALSQIVALLVTIPIISFYWLMDSVRIRNFFLSLLPEARREAGGDILADIAGRTGAFIRGQAIAMLIVGLLTYVGLSILGVNYALVLAVVAGVLELIPFIGPPISAIPAIIIALLASPVLALEVVALYVVVQQVESNVIIPNVMRRAVGVHPLVIISGLGIGASLFGLPGALLAVPVSASLQVIFVRIIAPWIQSRDW